MKWMANIEGIVVFDLIEVRKSMWTKSRVCGFEIGAYVNQMSIRIKISTNIQYPSAANMPDIPSSAWKYESK